MGDRFFLPLPCASCGVINEDVYYAPTCDFTDFVCKSCGLINDINFNFSTSIQNPADNPKNCLACGGINIPQI
jgi:hypothetical protein